MSSDIGNKGEQIVAEYFESIGYDVEFAPRRVFYSYDLIVTSPNTMFTIEVKTDVSAYRYAERRGEPNNPRLFIEYYNDTKHESSGIIASDATYWFYLLVNPSNEIECLVFDRAKLFEWLTNNDVRKQTIVPRFNDYTTTGWLPYRSDFNKNNGLKRDFLIGYWQND